MKKVVIGLLFSVMATAATAGGYHYQPQHRHGHYHAQQHHYQPQHRHRHNHYGAAAVISGLIIGAAVANAYGYPTVPYPAPVQRYCEQRPVFDAYGRVIAHQTYCY